MRSEKDGIGLLAKLELQIQKQNQIILKKDQCLQCSQQSKIIQYSLRALYMPSLFNRDSKYLSSPSAQ